MASYSVFTVSKFLTIILIISFTVPANCSETNLKSNKLPLNINSWDQSIVNTSSGFTTTENSLKLTVKKWQVGRVSRKHYEIVNMLWRKTKIFINPETTTPSENRFRRNHRTSTTTTKYENIKPLTHNSRLPSASSTPSYIEFYYLDDNDDRIKRRDSLLPTLTSNTPQQKPVRDNLFIRSPILSLRVNDHLIDSLPKTNLAIEKENPETAPQARKRPIINQKPSIYGFLSNKFKIDLAPMIISNNHLFNNKHDKKHVTTEKYFNNETCPVTTEPQIPANLTTLLNKLNTHNKTHDDVLTFTPKNDSTESQKIETTTAYDKIKFFEMYDQNTVLPISIINRVRNKDESENMVMENEINVIQKVNLEDVDHNIGYHDGTKVKNVKKHIYENSAPITHNMNSSNSEPKLKFKTVMFHVNKTVTKKTTEVENPLRDLKKHQSDALLWKNSSRIAMWSEYPFAAVYIFEPLQIHCDAAALSPHWLVTAGSCLSRFHRKDPLTEGRSAFVAYCGQNWWQPERVAYVKYSIVHPKFHPKDTRRFLYNIGLVQVVGSMASCFGWAPISLMSHNFAADADGSLATAVGWGLDRYDVRFTSVELPRVPLSAYNGFVYSTTCPGSKGFGKVKLYSDESVVVRNNMYCLSLPPYSGEENDPIHGSLLLVGGKLIALYLQMMAKIVTQIN
ncbi:uncharacterized protein LOC135071496 isoform X2 [Ostrinia nubilalis]|uniref:uncharacterized protein LOC135071496 isoform X2 n=1 Tax=Ostrinia nubilalis TaxID=29057 RepID=UPI0030823D46